MADVIPLPEPGTNTTISRTLKALMAYQDVDRGQMAAALGIKRATFYTRLKGQSDWSAEEVARAAVFFRVSPMVFFDGLPRLDSNQQPSDLQFRPTILADWRERKHA